MSWWQLAVGAVGDLALVYFTTRYFVIPKLDARARRIAQYEITLERRLRWAITP